MKKSIPSCAINRLIVLPVAAILVSFAIVVNAAAFDRTNAEYDALLKRYVTAGRVNYKEMSADAAALDRYLDSVAGVSETVFNAWPEADRLALLINLYNAATLKLIVDHYPTKSIKDIGSFFKGPWDQPLVRLFGHSITLDNLEHDIIRKDYSEPRIHLALVCAAKGCPPLRSEAYVAVRLDDQLDDQSRQFLDSPAGLRIDREGQVVYFSSIFKWYGKDFIDRFSPRTGFSGLDKIERAVAHFSSGYLPAADGDYLRSGAYSVKYLDYDWSLNEK